VRLLVLGLAAVLVGDPVGVASTIASAAPLLADGRPDLTASPAYTGVLGDNQRATIPVVVENKGGATSRPVSVTLMISQGLADRVVRGAFGQAWSCDEPTVGRYSGVRTLTCTTDGLDAESHKALLVTGTGHELSDVWIVAIADPDNAIDEADEANNRGKQNVGPYPDVIAPQFLES
jgi:hypothetical protein